MNATLFYKFILIRDIPLHFISYCTLLLFIYLLILFYYIYIYNKIIIYTYMYNNNSYY